MDKPVVYTHSALKRKETLTHATAQMNAEEIMLSEINQPWKDKHTVRVHSYEVHEIVKFI